ncbi:hypothetical protein FRC18_004863 [Serendipita sp. 400]|nr:hypothetical protein FRC18_004863 [Serendipita sp. 400]
MPRYVCSDFIEIARCLPNLRDVGFIWGKHRRCYRSGTSVLDHLESFSMFSMLENITLPNISQLGLGYKRPPVRESMGFLFDSSLEDRLATQKEQAIERLLGGMEEILLTKHGSWLQSVVVGDIICEVGANRRFRRS